MHRHELFQTQFQLCLKELVPVHRTSSRILDDILWTKMEGVQFRSTKPAH